MKNIREQFEKAKENIFNNVKGGFNRARELSDFTDKILRYLYRHAGGNRDKTRMTIVGLGGYGRREMFPASDIDIMFLYDGKLSPHDKELSRVILYELWDTGIDIGNSVRNISTCLKLARHDITVLSSFIEARRIAGDRDIFRKFQKKISFPGQFVNKKFNEWKNRHKIFNNSSLILEPDIKEVPGGLRDYHTVMWMARIRLNIHNIKKFVDMGWLSDEDYKHLMKSLDFLLDVRWTMHFIRKSRSNILSLDIQHEIAPIFSPGSLLAGVIPSEKFMQMYYQNAFFIYKTTRFLIERTRKLDKKMKLVPVETLLLTDGRELYLNEDKCFDRAETLLQVFRISQKKRMKFDVTSRDFIEKKIKQLTPDKSPETYKEFMNILSGTNVYETLEVMYETGMLYYLLPEFKNLFGHIKHDAYHTYTTDKHTLLIIYYLETLCREKKHSLEILSELMKETNNKPAIYLAALFHDIGKGKGGSHVERGLKIFREFAGLMNLDKPGREYIEFLINSHLIMNYTAQRRNLEDPQTIRQFASQIKNKEYLKGLYLLTYGDLRAVGPDIWTEWKSSLTRELYIKTSRYLDGLPPMMVITPEEYRKLRDDTIKSVSPALGKKWVSDFFSSLGEEYFSVFNQQQIKLHIYFLNMLQEKKVLVDFFHHHKAGYTELMVAARNREGLFSKIAGLLSGQNINIMNAKIFTTRHGLVLDIFHVCTRSGTPVRNNKKWERFTQNLEDVIDNDISLDDYLVQKPSILRRDRINIRKKKKKAVFLNDASEKSTVLEILAPDRLGLLYNISRILAEEKININSALIDTHLGHVHDVFYITSLPGLKKLSGKKIKILTTQILSVL